jgi:thiamine-phosphate pyrophosphorylase
VKYCAISFDEVSLAKEINADGIHVGQDDAKVKEIAQYFTDKIIGLSISALTIKGTSY